MPDPLAGDLMSVDRKDPKYKDFFSYRKFVEDALREIFHNHPHLISQLDFATLKRAPAELISKDFKVRYTDSVWLCTLKDSTDLICFPFEFQSRPDPNMPLRILVYSALLLESVTKERKFRTKDHLPPVLATVCYHGERRWNVPRNVHRMFDQLDDAELQAHLPSIGYQLVEERQRVVEQLPAQRSLYLALLGIIYSRTVTQALTAVQAARRWLSDAPEDRELKQAFTDLFIIHVSTNFPQFAKIMEEIEMEEIEMDYMSKQFIKSINSWEANTKQEGLEEGIRRTLQNLLAQKFGTVPAAKLKRIDSAQFEQLDQWINRIIGANSLEEVFNGKGAIDRPNSGNSNSS